MSSTQLTQLLFRLGQISLLEQIKGLSPSCCARLEKELVSIDIQKLEQALRTLKDTQPPPLSYTPLKQYTGPTNGFDEGIQTLKEGKVATVILAGGQASRFKHKGAKATFPISLIKQKSLLQLHLEKARACMKAYKTMPHIAIMTSETTHEEIQSHLEKQHYFGLEKSRIDLFQQPSMPLYSLAGDFIFNQEGDLLTGPDGNGGCFWYLASSDIIKKWKAAGIEYVSVILIDNPLIDPFSAQAIAEHKKNQVEATAWGIFRESTEEQVGVFVQKTGHIGVVEYSEMSTNDFYAVDQKGFLQYPLANIGSYIFSLPFIETLVQKPQAQLLLHKAIKKTTDEQLAFLHKQSSFEITKLEYFIFDVLDSATKAQVFVEKRSDCFAPLKTQESIPSVQKALLTRDCMQYERITGIPAPKERLFELSLDFYYPSAEFLSRWKNKPLPNSAYIEDIDS